MFQGIKTFSENLKKWLAFTKQISIKNKRLLFVAVILWAAKAIFQFATVFISAKLLGEIQTNLGDAYFSVSILFLLVCFAIFPAISAFLDNFAWNFEGHLETLIESTFE